MHTDFALRTLMYLGSTAARTTASHVAGVFGISANHLAKVVHRLAQLGYVRSARGIGGGIQLARRPEDIRLGEVIEAFEGNMHLLECVQTEGVCVIESFCKLKGALAEAERVQLDFLNSVTLRDVIPTSSQFRRVAGAAS